MAITLTFTDEELEELQRLLDSESRRELIAIHRADSREFSHALKTQYELDELILQKIRSARPANAV